jgi:hypothetical protein
MLKNLPGERGVEFAGSNSITFATETLIYLKSGAAASAGYRLLWSLGLGHRGQR